MLVDLPVSDIDPGDNDRIQFDEEALAQLAESIRRNGLAQPISVRPKEGRYEIVAGERRFRAIAEVLGWPTITAVVRDMDDRTASDVMLVENLARIDLDPVAEARSFQRRMDRFDIGTADIAATAGVSQKRVTNRLKLLNLIPEAQHLVAVGQLKVGWTDVLSVLDTNRQRAALKVLATSDVPFGTWRELCKKLKFEQDTEPMFDADLFSVEEAIADADETATPWSRRQVVVLLGNLVDGLDGLDGLELPPDVDEILDRARSVVETQRQSA